MFEQVRQDAQGVLQSAQVEVRLRWIERLIEGQEFLGALRGMISLLSYMTTLNMGRAAWREVILEGVKLGLVSGERGVLEELVDGYLWMGWPADSPDVELWEILDLCMANESAIRAEVGLAFGEFLARHDVKSAVGPYVAGHFAERRLFERSFHGDARVAYEHFRHGCVLARQQYHVDFARHIALRQGVCGLLFSHAQSDARTLLKRVDRAECSDVELLWYSIGMIRSTYWLDRVRGLDVLDELAAKVCSHMPGYGLSVARIRQGVEWVLYQDLWKAGDSELDRLKGVIQELVKADEEAEGLLHVVELGEVLSGEGSLGLKESDELLGKLWGQSKSLGSEWSESIMAARWMRAHLLQEEGWENLGAFDSGDPVWSLIDELLVWLGACREGAASEVLEVMDRLHQRIKESSTGLNVEMFRAFFVVLPEALKRLQREKPAKRRKSKVLSEEDEQKQQAQEELFERLSAKYSLLIQEVVRLHVAEPGYGWWALAAHLIKSQLFDAAELVTREALESRAEVDEKLHEFVMGSMLYWASARQDDQVTMMFWLEQCSPH